MSKDIEKAFTIDIKKLFKQVDKLPVVGAEKVITEHEKRLLEIIEHLSKAEVVGDIDFNLFTMEELDEVYSYTEKIENIHYEHRGLMDKFNRLKKKPIEGIIMDVF